MRPLEPLDAAGRKSLDEGLYMYLLRGHKCLSSIQAHMELHTEAEINASLKRLKQADRVRVIVDGRLGYCWQALTSEDDCEACQHAQIHYAHSEKKLHSCLRTSRTNDKEAGPL